MDLTSDNYGIENLDNIVFVDIDGVFTHNNTKCTYEFLEEPIDTLNILYDEFKINLVLSSSWKYSYSFAFMQKLFKDNGIKAPLIDKTFTVVSAEDKKKSFLLSDIDEENYLKRDYEIYKWLQIFKPTHFLILDDFKMTEFGLREHQCLTYFWHNNPNKLALTKNNLDECRKILKM